MAGLIFPQNIDVGGRGVGQAGAFQPSHAKHSPGLPISSFRRDGSNEPFKPQLAADSGFSRIWLGFFEHVYRRLKAAEAVTDISTADVGAAGGAYSQTYADQQTALINELKAKVNALHATLRT